MKRAPLALGAAVGVVFASVMRKLPLCVSVLAVLILEIVPPFAIRDNLVLLSPSDSVRAWQAG